MSNNKNNSGMYGKGYYIALILCAAAIGISGYMYYRNTQQNNETLQEPPAAAEATAEPREDVAVVVTQPPAEASSPTTGAAEAPTEKQTLKTTAPVEGQTVAAYAMDALSYNQTTRDWRTHSGMDIAAAAGTQVVAAADGVVYTTYEDDRLGTTVVIRHDGGYTTQYSSLSKELSVSAGDTVAMGQVIGCVGSTALLESALGDHVHFSVTYRDQQMDPAEFLALGRE